MEFFAERFEPNEQVVGQHGGRLKAVPVFPKGEGLYHI